MNQDASFPTKLHVFPSKDSDQHPRSIRDFAGALGLAKVICFLHADSEDSHQAAQASLGT